MRELVAIRLRSAGLDDARHRIPARRLSEAIAIDERSDILGIYNWHLGVHADLAPRWGSRLDAAEQSAALAGVRNAAVVEFRRERDVGDFFVVMTLDQFARLVPEQSATDTHA